MNKAKQGEANLLSASRLPDFGSPADRWRSLDSKIVQEMSLIIDNYLLKYGLIGMMRRKHEIFAMLLKRHPEIEEEVTSYFWEGVRLQKNGFEWGKDHREESGPGDRMVRRRADQWL